jgi:hypothetical protein
MNSTVYSRFHSAPLVLRSGKRRDHFRSFTILLCLALAVFGLIYGAPPLPGAEADGVPVVFGP